MRVPRLLHGLGVALAVIGCAALLPASAHATFPGANGKIVFSKDGDLWTINPDGTELEQITSGPRQDWQPAWSPDGSRVAFNGDDCAPCASWSRGYDGLGVYVRRPDGSVTRFGDNRFDYTDAAWSPEGQLVFATERNAKYIDPPGQFIRLMVANLDGSDQRFISGGLPPVEPDWSPLGDRIAVLQHYDGSVLGFYTPDGAFTPGPNIASNGDIPIVFSPSWSPDGTRIAYSGSMATDGFCPGRCAVTIEPDGDNLQRLSPDPNAYDVGTAWSPDGAQVAYVHRNEWDDPPEIWLVDADGGNAHFLTDGTDPSWQPRVPPHSVAPARIFGVARERQTLTAGHGRWFATPELAYTYQWALCDVQGEGCAAIAGATAQSYTLTGDAVMHTLRVTVTVTNDLGQSSETSFPSPFVGDVVIGTAAADTLRGTRGPDASKGLGGGDVLGLGAGDDIGRGGPGQDVVIGGAGRDVLVGGPGRDRLRGGSGRDRVYARDRFRDVITCGPGRDCVGADHRDLVAGSCEIVRYG